jgi:outer membrane receptor protein involved in Fe transport
VPRFGLHYRPAPGNDLIASLIYSDRTEDLKQDIGGGDTLFDTLQTKGYDVQAEYLFRSDPVNLAVGAGTSDLSASELQRTVGPSCPIPPCDFATDTPIHQYNVYGYMNANLPKSVSWTAGLSFDSFKETGFSLNAVNPKAGVAWDITDRLRLRVAYIETVKRTLSVEQTLEPTQVAGFNQFFDDVNGTKARRYGLGMDWQVTDDLSAGIEASRRDLDVPVDFGTGTFLESQNDDLYRAYAYWSFADNWAATAEFAFEDFGRSNFVASAAFVPDAIHTFSVPVAIEYFGSSGIFDGVFGRLGVTFVHQMLDFPSGVGPSRDDSFALVDAAIGYRLPNRYGIVSLEARNLFDEKFHYQDISFQTPRTPNPRFIPDRTIMARITLSF